MVNIFTAITSVCSLERAAGKVFSGAWRGCRPPLSGTGGDFGVLLQLLCGRAEGS